jgi:hypothetical protein
VLEVETEPAHEAVPQEPVPLPELYLRRLSDHALRRVR